MSDGSLPSSWMGLVCGRDARSGCRLNVIDAARDLLLAFSWTLILIYTSVSQRRYTVKRPVIRYGVHDLRWACAVALVVVHLADFGESLLAKRSTQVSGFSVCLPVFHALSVCYSCVYFDRMEVTFVFFLHFDAQLQQTIDPHVNERERVARMTSADRKQRSHNRVTIH